MGKRMKKKKKAHMTSFRDDGVMSTLCREQVTMTDEEDEAGEEEADGEDDGEEEDEDGEEEGDETE